MHDADRHSVRALLRTPDGAVLLMRVAGHDSDLWILPGGRREAGERSDGALRRELGEELGLDEARIGPELWVWRHVVRDGAGDVVECERAFLVETSRFEPTTARMNDEERRRFRGFRWWRRSEIAGASEVFVPVRLGTLLEDLGRMGPPPSPRAVEGLRGS